MTSSQHKDADFLGRLEKKLREALFDVEKQEKRLRLGEDEVVAQRDLLKTELKQSPKTRFWAFEDFETSHQGQDNKIKVANQYISYWAQGHHQENPQLLASYQRFLEQYTMLVATIPNHPIPPFARIELNRLLKEQQIIPDHIQLRVEAGLLGDRPLNASSKHVVSVGLDASDHELIQQAKQHRRQYRLVKLSDYRGLPAADSPDPK